MRTGIGLSLIALLAASAPTAEPDSKPPATQPAASAGGVASKTDAPAGAVRERLLKVSDDKQYLDLDGGRHAATRDPAPGEADVCLRVKGGKAEVVALDMQLAEAWFTGSIESIEIVEQLGESVYRKRQEAQQALLQIGAPAIPALRKAAGDRDAERASRARSVLRTAEERTWGQAAGGVQVRLRPFRSSWKLRQTPVLTLDIRNTSRGIEPGTTGPRLVPGSLRAHERYSEAEVDGRWYQPRDRLIVRIPGRNKVRRVDRGQTTIDACTIELVGRSAPRLLSPGRHVIRVAFRGNLLDAETVVSNPVEVMIRRRPSRPPDGRRTSPPRRRGK